MNRYNSKIAKLFQPLPWKGKWAVTLGQTTYFSCSEAEVSERWHRHEDEHKRQWREDGALKFALSYLWQGITKGYTDISYEYDSREAEKG